MFWHTQKKDIKTILPVHMYLQKLQYQIMNQVCGCVCVCVCSDIQTCTNMLSYMVPHYSSSHCWTQSLMLWAADQH